ncbi:MAG: hypothetical protein L0Z62_36685 [Gemmataceae bacterium]|nr:hypothetical protein [Gemmataceae bacterium]
MAILESRVLVGQEVGQEFLDRVKPLPSPPPFVIACHLFDFAIGSSILKADHEQWLSVVAAPYLNDNAAATFQLLGTASRSGSASFNQKLSERRLQAVLDFLTKKPRNVPIFKLVTSAAVGELLGERAGQRDGTEDPLLRAVTILMFIVDARQVDDGTRQTIVASVRS